MKNINLFVSFGIVCCALCPILTGCGGDKSRPADLPKLHPVTITVTSEDQPLENAVVSLVASPPLKYQAITPTDAEGKAVMKTYGYEGVPEGKFRVVITRDIDDDFVYVENSDGTQGIGGSTRYRTIDTLTYQADTTPFEIEVPSPPNQNTVFEVGKTVKVKY